MRLLCLYLLCLVTCLVVGIKGNYEVVLSSPISQLGAEMPMTDVLGHKYMCILPEEAKIDENGEHGGLDSESPAVKDYHDLFASLEGKCVLRRTQEWWSYEFCYEKQITQFHVEEDKVVGSTFDLGKFTGKPIELVAEGDLLEDGTTNQGNPYLRLQYEDGDYCTEVAKARSSEVRVYCSPDTATYISGVRESASCTYVITVVTPLTCAARELRPTREPPQRIWCDFADKYEEYKERIPIEIANREEQGLGGRVELDKKRFPTRVRSVRKVALSDQEELRRALNIDDDADIEVGEDGSITIRSARNRAATARDAKDEQSGGGKKAGGERRGVDEARVERERTREEAVQQAERQRETERERAALRRAEADRQSDMASRRQHSLSSREHKILKERERHDEEERRRRLQDQRKQRILLRENNDSAELEAEDE